jgi:hypothetical protein
MPDEFNPYYVWLGIPPAEQPANYYRLLGIALFEPSADVIDSAADRQTAHLRTFQTGKHSDLSQRLLNEVAAARVCLLDSKKRAEYDRQLRARLVVRTPAAPATQPGAPQAAAPVIPTAPILRRPAAAAPASAPQAADQWDDLLGPGDAKQRPAIARAAAQSRKAAAAKRAAANRMLAVGAAVGLAVLGVVGFAVYSQMNPAPATLVFDWPGVQRSDVSASVDGAAILIPATGPWEYACPPGEHHVVAQRPGYKLSETVTAEAGQRQAVPANWQPKAALVLNWRPVDRAGATLIIDGQPHPVSQQEPLELPVEPGRHSIQIIRPGVAPFSAAITLDADRREMVNVPRPPTEATLALAWPEAERSDAGLTIDGAERATAAKAAANPAVLELTMPPGRHSLRITRPGFETFALDVDLVPGPNHAIKPVWTPEKPAVADTGPKPAPEEKPVHPVKKYPIPPAAEQQQIAKQLDDIYQLSKPGPVDPALAQRLLDVAANPGSSPAERYMLLAKGAERAVAAGDVALAMQTVDTLAADYEIAPLDVKQKLLDRFATVGKPDQMAAAIPIVEQLMDQAVADDDFERAIALANIAGKVVARGPAANRKESEDRLALRRHDFRLMIPMLAAVKQAEETLAKTPDDPEANAKVGRWRCLYKNDWAGGLPLLAKGNDEKLKAVAEREQKSPTDAEQQVELADAWWDLSKSEGATVHNSLRSHAADIYRAAMPNLTSALKKASIEKRLADVTPPPRAATPPTVRKEVRYLAELPADEVSVQEHPHHNDPGFGFKGIAWPHSIWAHPPWGKNIFSHVAYHLDGQYSTLAGEVGIGGVNNIPASALTFRVVGDGKTLWNSKPMQAPGIAVPFRVDVRSIKKLELFVDCPGSYDRGWAWWIEPTLETVVTTVASSESPGSGKSAPAGKFPIGQWVDVLSLVDTKRDAVAGEWTRDDNGIISSTGNYPQISIPITVDGSYDFEVEFTRNSGIGDVATVFSIGSHSCLAGLSAFSGEVSGLCNLDGIDAHDLRNPIAVRPGTLTNNHRYREFLRVQSVSPGVARVNLSLDGKAYFPAWSGDPAALSVPPVWTPECPRGLKLGGPNVTFHTARLRVNSGSASSTFAAATPVTEPVSNQFKLGQWVDVLSLVDTTRDTGSGDWNRTADGITSGTDRQPRIGIPITIEGSYDLEVEFTRNSGAFDIGTIFSIGSHSCLLSLSAYGGKASGLCDLNGLDVNDPADPIAVRPGNLENGHRYRELLKIQSVSPTVARVAVSLDGKPYLPKWTGDPAVLSVNSNWGPGSPRSLALCGPNITFHSARLRLNSGHAESTVASATPFGQRADKPRGNTKPAPPRFKPGQWVDVLRLIDTKRDAVAGAWKVNGAGLNVASGTGARIVVPVMIDGGYDFDAEFTRTMGAGSINFIIPVGSHACMAVLGGWKGGASGLMDVDGRDAMNPGNPIAVRPGPIETGHRYRASVRVRILSKARAIVDVWLDGKPYLPHWEGNPPALSNNAYWALPNPNRLGLAAQETDATFHSARLRLVSGSAELDSDEQATDTPGAATAKKSIAAGNYTITSKADGRFLAPSDNSNHPGTTTVAAREPSGDKVWVLELQPGGSFKLANSSGVVLGIRQDLKDPGVDAILWSWGGTDGQLWNVLPIKADLVKIVNKNSGLCLSIRASDGQGIVQEPWSNLPTQQWKLIPSNP